MDAAAKLGRNPVSRHQIQPEYGDEKDNGDGTAESVSRDQILRRERGQRNILFFQFSWPRAGLATLRG